MSTLNRTLMPLTMAALLFCALPQAALARGKAKQERVPRICNGLSSDQKPLLAVMDFEEKAGPTGVGGGMATMLMNALGECGCFRVLEAERVDELMAEQRLGMSGAIRQGTAAATGEMLGAQFLVMGTITEFSENESNAGVSGAGWRRPGRLWRRIAGSVGMSTAHVGFVIRVVDPSTREVVVSQSFDKKRRTIGVMGQEWWGGGVLTGLGFKSKALGDAVEEGLIDAIGFIAQERESMLRSTSVAQSRQDESPSNDPARCARLASGDSPRIMVLIPEEHILGDAGSYAADRNPYRFEEHEVRAQGDGSGVSPAVAVAAMARAMIRPPDPAGETEIIKRLLEFGYTVVDPKQVETLREQELERFLQVHDDPALAASVGRQFGADIVITGEAFSEFAMNLSDMYSCRARVEAKAVDARTGRILAADGFHGSGLDVSEVIAGKTALRNAGAQVADYFIGRICQDTGGEVASALTQPASVNGGSRLVVRNIDYRTSSELQQVLSGLAQVEDVERTFKDRAATFVVTHTGTTEELADALLARTADLGLEITGLADREIAATLPADLVSSNDR